MNIRIVFSIIILALGVTAAMIPGRTNDSLALDEKALLQEILLEENHLNVDEVAELIISGDPAVQLIDVRSNEVYPSNALPGAINIPLDSVLSANFEYLFDQPDRRNVIYSENDKAAAQVWMIVRQRGYGSNYLMKGGLEHWNRTILNPESPEATASREAFDLYAKRLAFRQFFTGAEALPKANVQPILPVRGKKKRRVEGGCS